MNRLGIWISSYISFSTVEPFQIGFTPDQIQVQPGKTHLGTGVMPRVGITAHHQLDFVIWLRTDKYCMLRLLVLEFGFQQLLEYKLGIFYEYVTVVTVHLATSTISPHRQSYQAVDLAAAICPCYLDLSSLAEFPPNKFAAISQMEFPPNKFAAISQMKLQPLPHAPPFPSSTHLFATKDHRFYHPSFQGSNFFQWVLRNPSSFEINKRGLGKIFEEMFERTVDMFEKAAYTQQCD
ncbi:hypothetical protein CFP56_004554 [Quercus suber]|uniref:Uncharacterized protein n=1 Tax=Quercus suber TaxID=58331 RepID=A0AAW0LB34_QUESU